MGAATAARLLPLLLPLVSGAAVRCPRFNGTVCAGHGTCNAAGICECEAGYARADCSVADFCPKDCSGHGTCKRLARGRSASELGTPGVCTCDATRAGAACDEYLPRPQCEALSFCSGHGECVCTPSAPRTRTLRLIGTGGAAETARVAARGGYDCSCACERGYAGAICDELVASPCPNACSGHGSCGILCGDAPCAGGPACTCDAGFVGDDCSLAVPTSTCPSSCSGHGTCHVDGCACDVGFSGADCATMVHVSTGADGAAPLIAANGPLARAEPSRPAGCPAACSGRGICGRDGVCICADGYGGDACYDLEHKCASSNCSAAGRCVRGVCACAAGAAGERCERAVPSAACPLGCSGRGTCIAAAAPFGPAMPVCVCDAGFSGGACERANAASNRDCPAHCSGHGRCVALELPRRREKPGRRILAAAKDAAIAAAAAAGAGPNVDASGAQVAKWTRRDVRGCARA